MKKTTKRIWISITAAFLLLVICANLSSVQTWICMKVVNSQDDVSLNVDSISLGLTKASINNLSAEYHGAKLSIKSAVLDYSPFKSLFNASIIIDNGAVTDFSLDLQEFVPPDYPETTSDSEFEFHGLKPFLKLPIPVIAKKLGINGSLVIPNPQNADTIKMVFDGNCQNIAPAQEAEFTMQSSLEYLAVNKSYPTVNASGRLLIHQTADIEIDMIGFEGSIHPSGEGTRADQGLKTSAKITIKSDHESYKFKFDTLGNNNPKMVFGANTKFTADNDLFHTKWESDLNDRQVAPFLYDRPIPEFLCQGKGELEFNIAKLSLRNSSSVKMQGKHWGRLHSSLEGIDYISFSGNNSFQFKDKVFTISSADMSMQDQDQVKLIDFKLGQKFSFDLASQELQLSELDKPFINLKIDSFPLHWIEALSPEVMNCEGYLHGEWVLTPEKLDTAAIKAVRALETEKLKLKLAAAPDPFDIKLYLKPEASYSPKGLSMEIKKSYLSIAKGPELQFAGSFLLPPKEIIAQLQGELTLLYPDLFKEIKNLDSINTKGKFVLDFGGIKAGLDQTTFEVKKIDGQNYSFGSFTTIKPVMYDIMKGDLDWANFQPDVLKCEINGFPTDWISKLIPELQISSGALYGELKATINDQGQPRVENIRPFEIRKLSLAWNDFQIIRNTSMHLEPIIDFTDKEFLVSLDKITMRSDFGDWTDASFTLSIPYENENKINFNGDVAAGLPSLTDSIIDLASFSSQINGTFFRDTRETLFSNFDFNFKNSKSKTFVNGKSLQAFRIKGQPFTITPTSQAPDLFSTNFVPLPIKEVFPKPLGFDLSGNFPEGDFRISTINNDLRVKTATPLEFKNISVFWKEIPILDSIGFSLTQDISYESSTIKIDSLKTELSAHGKPLATLTANASIDFSNKQMNNTARLSANAYLAEMLKQPVGRGFNQFSSGQLLTEIDYKQDKDIVANFSTKLEQLILSKGNDSLPSVSLHGTYNQDQDGNIDSSIPFVVARDGVKSELKLVNKVKLSDGNYAFRSKLSGEQFIVDDIMDLINALLPISDDSKEDKVEEPGDEISTEDIKENVESISSHLLGKRDDTPFWGDNIRGEATFDLKELKFESHKATDLGGKFLISDRGMAIDSVSTNFLGSTLNGGMILSFDNKLDQPYDLKGAMELNDLDMAKVFLVADPNAKPTLEGSFSINGNASSKGENALDVLLNTLGEINVNNTGGGIFRGLKTNVGALSFLSGTMGVLTFSKEFRAIGRLIKQLSEFPYSRMELKITRAKASDFQVEKLSLVSPLISAEGHGGFKIPKDDSILNSPLGMSMQIGSKGDMNILFAGMKMSQENPGEGGYYYLKEPFAIGGTIAEPDAARLYQQFEEATENAGGSFGWALRLAKKQVDKALFEDPKDKKSEENKSKPKKRRR